MSGAVEPEAASTHPEAVSTYTTDEIKRTSGPQTTDGKRWEVRLSATPSREWRELFRTIAESSRTVAARRLEFDRATAVFGSDEDHVKLWIESIDRWFASTNEGRRVNVEREQRERSDRLDADAKARERIQELNDRFRNL